MAGKRKILHIGLFLSLLLNAFLIGFIYTNKPDEHSKYHHKEPSKRLYEAAENLTPGVRVKVIEILDLRQPAIDEQKKMGKGAYLVMRETLTSEDLQTEELDKIFREMAQHHEQMGLMIGGMFKEISEQIPDTQERIKFFDQAMPKKPWYKNKKSKE